jgi:hypothetical protein
MLPNIQHYNDYCLSLLINIQIWSTCMQVWVKCIRILENMAEFYGPLTTKKTISQASKALWHFFIEFLLLQHIFVHSGRFIKIQSAHVHFAFFGRNPALRDNIRKWWSGCGKTEREEKVLFLNHHLLSCRRRRRVLERMQNARSRPPLYHTRATEKAAQTSAGEHIVVNK